MLDVAIVGGGPAGLAAALMLGRSRKNVVLFDAGPPRNAAAVHVQGFLTRDGVPPADLRRLAHAELDRYGIAVRAQRIDEIEPAGRGFKIAGEMFRRVLLCTGVKDCVPGLYSACWGTHVLQCPYCHAYELADREYAFLATKPDDLDHALLLRGWSKHVVALATFPVEGILRDQLEKAKVPIEARPLRAVEPTGDRVRLRLEGGERVVDRVFAHPAQCQTELV
jgi:thioredoxin reductase